MAASVDDGKGRVIPDLPHDAKRKCRRRESKAIERSPSASIRAGSGAIAARTEATGAASGAKPRCVNDSVNDSTAVETMLAKALEHAAAAQRWDVVSQLAEELRARRLSHDPNVVELQGGPAPNGRARK
jgi:hypothetical protein